MKSLYLGAIALFASASVFAAPTAQLQSNYAKTVFNAGINSAAATFGGGGVTLNAGKNSSASVVGVSGGTALSSTTIGLGLTAGIGGTLGADGILLDDAAAGSIELTAGVGGTGGISSTSLASHTDNYSVVGDVDGKGKVKGDAFSYSGADAGNYLNIKYKTVNETYDVLIPEPDVTNNYDYSCHGACFKFNP